MLQDLVFKEKLLQYEDEFKIQYAAEGGEDDYQLVVVDVISHDGKERITLYTRVGEERPTEFDFKKTANECRARIRELEEQLEQGYDVILDIEPHNRLSCGIRFHHPNGKTAFAVYVIFKFSVFRDNERQRPIPFRDLFR